MKVRGTSRFIGNYTEASRKLRTGSGKPKGLGKKRKALEEQERKEQARNTGILLGSLKEVFKNKK